METEPSFNAGTPRVLFEGPSAVRRGGGVHVALEAHEWFLSLMREHEEFEVERDRAGELPVPFVSETVRQMVVE